MMIILQSTYVIIEFVQIGGFSGEVKERTKNRKLMILEREENQKGREKTII